MHRWPFVVAGQNCLELPDRRAQRVSKGLGDPSGMRMHERGMPDRIVLRIRSEFANPGPLVSAGDRS
ncbi:Uncharacterised protein [Mycobacterium tuberculosis]|uniref:Uncharacterized protein n=1 Tax=Mycobacterium tuberculosis TaxID=1773 RepID=A0A654U6V6_MYCTX|nr:Uncharacterised protein [Mycobacterium tuberculosis]CKV83321.1 Uncharacterised protein [Mycobacterium tuberculosis]COZ69607.1 Uncharacterised protein [Mycobacterium tuberculosis]